MPPRRPRRPAAAAQIPRVKVSLAAVYAFMLVGWPTIIYYTGLDGWAKYWLMPWLGYHFWMSEWVLRLGAALVPLNF